MQDSYAIILINVLREMAEELKKIREAVEEVANEVRQHQ